MRRIHITARTLAVTALFAVGTSASLADTQVGAQTISDENMIVVQIHCNDLVTSEADSASAATGTPNFSSSGGATGPEGGQVAGDPAGSVGLPMNTGGSGGDGSTVGPDDAPEVDVEAITLEDCRAAGLVN
ncbi:hypothetical protein SAMN05216456_2155 [Devosia crocina]|uniref:Secreted protein n=1 Tax=Devosia crocina TaxID=429728 RepID=A0A1I7NLD6_9HYPH|nr:hypothetical protein [Devosia crocina]SFV35467.1 hypothetical protein SAMN05216456_2155 [Devosia crocina]